MFASTIAPQSQDMQALWVLNECCDCIFSPVDLSLICSLQLQHTAYALHAPPNDPGYAVLCEHAGRLPTYLPRCLGQAGGGALKPKTQQGQCIK